MKTILYFIFLSVSIQCFSQHPELSNNTWFLTELEINGVVENAPNNQEVLYISSNFIGDVFLTEICENGFLSHVTYTSNNIFNFTDFTPTSGNCISTENNDYKTKLINFYQDEIDMPFNYVVSTEVDNTLSLTITSSNGNIAIYNNSFFNMPHQELTDNDWFLQSMTVNDTEYLTPNNTELSNVYLSFNPPTTPDVIFYTSVCATMNGQQRFDYLNSQFNLYDMALNNNYCSNENIDFENLYYYFYIDHNTVNTYVFAGPFTYSIIENGSLRTLTITNSLGDIAIYSNSPLTTPDYTQNQISIYPNPVKDTFTIENNNISIQNIELFNVLGKKVLENQNKEVFISNLENGIYLVKIALANGEIINEKIIKK